MNPTNEVVKECSCDTTSQLVSLGNYLLSKERDATIKNEDNKDKGHDCDLANWMEQKD